MTKPKAKTGRPTSYSDEIAAAICDRLSKGETLASICRDDHMPAVRTVSDWKASNAVFSADFAHAREDGFDAIAARTRQTARGHAAENGGDSTSDVQRDKLIIETDLKLLAKWSPKRYGDKTQTELTGADGGPIETKLTVTFV